jgi:hypothetical protein
MGKIELNAFDLAQRFVGVTEVSGTASNPQVLAMLRLDEQWPEGDDILVLGGNQSDSVSVSRYPSTRLLGIRRLV